MTQPDTAKLLQDAAEKMELFVDDKRLFQIFVHHTDGRVGSNNDPYDAYRQDAIAFGWYDGLLIRILPCYYSPSPSSIRDYIVRESTLQKLLDFVKTSQNKIDDSFERYIDRYHPFYLKHIMDPSQLGRAQLGRIGRFHIPGRYKIHHTDRLKINYDPRYTLLSIQLRPLKLKLPENPHDPAVKQQVLNAPSVEDDFPNTVYTHLIDFSLQGKDLQYLLGQIEKRLQNKAKSGHTEDEGFKVEQLTMQLTRSNNW